MAEDTSDTTRTKRPALLQRRESRFLLPRLPVWRDNRAWLTSCVFHTIIFVALALLWQPRSRGTGESIDQPVGIALVHQTNNGEEYFLSGGSSGAASAQGEASAVANPASALNSDGPPIAVSELMAELVGPQGTNLSPTSGDGSGNGDGLSGVGSGGSGSGVGRGKSTASFMGLRGTGSSFVYVLDRSASMLEFEGAPMRFAKKELLNSIRSLEEKNQFQIVFYNESPGALNPGTNAGRLLTANETNKDRAIRFVQAITPQGGTEHIPGLKMGLSFSPDVLFFLTDAAEPAMSEAQLIEIQSRAERSLTTIHTIQFNQGPETNDGGWIRILAEMNRGTYRYVDILTLE